MTDQPIETADESRISRRSALKAAVGAGVGAVAWTGPQITSFGATPAYAQGCTGFTVDEFADDRNTNQGSCTGKKFRYQDDSGITLPTNYTWDWTTLECPDNVVNFDYPDGITCSVDIYLYRSEGGAGQYEDYYSLHTFDLPDGGGSFQLPDGDDVGIDPDAPDGPPPTGTGGDNWSNTRFAVRVQCITSGLEHCL